MRWRFRPPPHPGRHRRPRFPWTVGRQACALGPGWPSSPAARADRPRRHFREGHIYDANGPALRGDLEMAANRSSCPGSVTSRPRSRPLSATAGEAADMVLTSGGVSVGRHDHIRDAIGRLGELDFWRIAVQPGKPLAVGRIDGRIVIGLPGNPVSALVVTELLVRPLLRAILGLAGDGRHHVPATLEDRCRKDPERVGLRPRPVRRTDTGWAAAQRGAASSQLRAMADANGLLVVPRGVPAGRAGEAYDTILLGEPTEADGPMKPTPPRRGWDARMVDVSASRSPIAARAEATLRMRSEVLRHPPRRRGPKGERVNVARLAGVTAAKRTAELIPLAHPLPLDVVEVSPRADRRRGRSPCRSRSGAHGPDRGRDGSVHRRRHRGADRVLHGQGPATGHRHRARPPAREVRRPKRRLPRRSVSESTTHEAVGHRLYPGGDRAAGPDTAARNSSAAGGSRLDVAPERWSSPDDEARLAASAG